MGATNYALQPTVSTPVHAAGYLRRRGRAVRALRFAGIVAVGVLLAACKPTTQATKTTPSGAPTSVSVSATASSLFASPVMPSPATVSVPPSASVVASGGSPPILTDVAAAQLATLAIKGRAPMTGYTRPQFGPAWPTENGCDARNEVLRRDLTKTTLQGSCTVETGTLFSPYTAQTINFVRGPNSAVVQIDHVVALGDAWQTGAQFWTSAKRALFANDPAELLAVDASSNDQKGDADAASWLPANKPFRCAYVAIQVSVKDTYGLWVTPAEHDAIARVLATCRPASAVAPSTTNPTVAPPKPAATTTAPVVTPPKPTPTQPAAGPTVVHGGAFCSPAGATGVTSTGKPEVCKTTPTDSRLRWRAA
jgi:hypothetical protein